MRNPSVAFATALAEAPTKGIVARRAIWIGARDRDLGTVQGFGFWTGDEDLAMTVVDGQTGTTVIKSFVGLGSSLVIPSIPRVSDLTVQILNVRFGQLDNAVQQMVREYTVRFAKCDIYEILLNTTSRVNAVANPELVFIGEVDSDPIATPAKNERGSITLDVVSDAIRALTRTNPAKTSFEQQKKRSGDQYDKFANEAIAWELSWGEK